MVLTALPPGSGSAAWRAGIDERAMLAAFLQIGALCFVICFRPGRLLRSRAQRRRAA